MEIQKQYDGDKLTIRLHGRLDTMSAPELEQELETSLEGVRALVLDLLNLAYISSAGLRVVLRAKKQMDRQQGGLLLTHVGEGVMEVFTITGFADMLDIQTS